MERDFRSAHFVENEQSCALSALEFTISSCARSLTLTLCPVKTEPKTTKVAFKCKAGIGKALVL